MQNIKKLALVSILPLIFFNVVLVQGSTNPVNIQQQIDQQSKIQNPNILAEEYLNIGKSFRKLGKYQEAIEQYDLALQYNPKYPEAYYNKGLL